MKRHSDCPWCKQSLPEGFYEAKSKLKADRIRARFALRLASGGNVGAPKKRDDKKIAEFRVMGWTLRAIADELKLSTGTVWKSLKEGS